MMLRQVEQLVRLIDDLLDVSRINTGKFELRRERVLLNDIIRDAVEASHPHIDAARHQLTVSIPDEPIVLDADRARISQSLLNLLNNAAKFTEPGGRITLSAVRENQAIEIRVRDCGIGIPPEMLPRMFEMFTQLDHSLERSRSGLGIGLSLVRTLVAMHGGTVTAHSAGAGRGSEFVIRLPLPVDQPAGSNGKARAATHAGEPVSLRILIVDDNHDAARSLALGLRNQGHVCRTVFDGPSALGEATEFAPQVVVLDIGMPEMSGYEVARRMRATGRFDTATLIAVTGWGQDEDRARSREAGFDHHLVKPVALDELRNLLKATRN
jgi:CheY-like chemotaxis protein/two-component sensor histidine kinase